MGSILGLSLAARELIALTTAAKRIGSGARNAALVQRLLELRKEKERVRGIEPPYAAWEAAVLPLNYTRKEEESL